ncbi:GNAT family N-acetyltransferase [Kordiimonas marina]|uniref:GNAT family N-acetyltransferase n=1 Tax=Kordiimonas marina TaxID=2872312 RepID=UPI001FF2B71E|nr:GNAT family N-acetyltransferase [Kordiimonas marina]MCJ9428512.1 GNAT family N-acetyltransferase [Kordiimonas marina]
MKIEPIESLKPHLPALQKLLIDTVADGASIGFHAPLPEEDAAAYWHAVERQLADGSKLMLVASESGTVLGTVQLALEMRPNGRHRAEVQKLMVAPAARGKGTAKALMAALEQAAHDAGRTLLVLDTRRGDIADGLYERLGYTRAGIIPDYVIDTGGVVTDTCIFYKHLK